MNVFAGAAFAAELSKSKERPFLLVGRGDYDMLRERWSREPGRGVFDNYVESARRGAGAGCEQHILLAIMEDSPESKQAAGHVFMRDLANYASRGQALLTGRVMPHHQPRPGATGPRYDFSGLRYIHRMLNQYDFIASFEVLSRQQRDEFENHVVSMIQRFMSPEVRAVNANYDDRRHNFHTDNITNIATAALSFPDHPDAPRWLDYALTDFEWQLNNALEDGAWHENPRYHGAVLRSMIPLAVALRRRAGVDFFKHEQFRNLLDWFVRVQSAPDRVYARHLLDGNRTGENGADTMAFPSEALATIPAIGDALWVNYWFAVLAMAAPAYKATDPQFAGRLMWAWRRAGGPYAPESRLLLQPLLLINPAIAPVQQTLASEHMGEAGYTIFRADSGKPSEHFFIMTAGKRREKHWAGHKHRDQNSFSLLAHGVPLALDPGTGPYRTPEQATWHKATHAHNTVLFAEQNQDKEDGRLFDYISTDIADYVVGDPQRAVTADTAMAMQWYRHVLFVKPDYYLIWDYIRGDVRTEWLLQTPAHTITETSYGLTAETAWGVSLDMHFILPSGKLQFELGRGRFGNWRREGQPGTPPFSHQTSLRVANDPGSDYLTVLHPRIAGQPSLNVERIGDDEHVLKVRRDRDIDYIALFAEDRVYDNEELGLYFEGRVGLVRNVSAGANSRVLHGNTLRLRGA